MPGRNMQAVDPLAQFDVLLFALTRQLEEAQRTAEELKRQRDSVSNLSYPNSAGGRMPEQGTKGTHTIVDIDDYIKWNDLAKVEEAKPSRASNEKIEPNPDEQMQPQDPDDQGLEHKTFAKLVQHKTATKSFLETPGEDSRPQLRRGINNNMPEFHQEFEEHFALNQGGFKITTYLVSFTAMFVIYAVIAILGFTVFDMHHEDEPWRYFAAEEVWDHKGVSKWASSYTGILHTMPLPDFQKFVCVTNWITVLYLGFGSEAIVGIYLLSRLGHEFLEKLWLIAQFCFPLLLSMAFQFAGQQNPWSYLFFIVGMWKFCFPETLFYLTRAMSFEQGFWQCAADVCNGMGTMVHHGSCALILCLLQADMLKMTQVALSNITPLILQHLVVLLKYQSLVLYALLELTLEIIWEREVFSIMQSATGTPWFCWVGLQGLLVAHWLYWLAVPIQGVADMLKSAETLEEEAEMQHDEIAKFQAAMSVGEGSASRKNIRASARLSG